MRCINIVIVVCLGAVVVGGCARRAGPSVALSNRALIGAMPDGAESVMVWRLDELQREAPDMKEAAEELVIGLNEKAETKEQIDVVLRRAIRTARPLVWAHSGSRFSPPSDLGVGDYNERSIWITERPLRELRRALDTGEGVGGPVQRHKIAGVRVYEVLREIEFYGGESMTEPMFIALPDPRTALAAESLEDIGHMLARHRDEHAEIPEQWRSAAARIEIESPMVMLRRYDPESEDDQFSPVRPGLSAERRIEIEAFALVLAEAEQGRYRLEVITRQPQRAEEAFFRLLLPEPLFTWTAETTGEGFAATVKGAVEQERHARDAILSLLTVFGMNLYI